MKSLNLVSMITTNRGGGRKGEMAVIKRIVKFGSVVLFNKWSYEIVCIGTSFN